MFDVNSKKKEEGSSLAGLDLIGMGCEVPVQEIGRVDVQKVEEDPFAVFDDIDPDCFDEIDGSINQLHAIDPN